MPAADASIALVTTTGSVQRFDRWSGTFLYAVSAIALGYALARGSADQRTLTSLLVAVSACLLGALSGTSRRLESLGDRPTVLLLAAGLVFQVGYLLTSPVGVDLSD